MRDAVSKIYARADLPALRARWKAEGKTVVFTNGCFDILHRGHVTYLNFARAQGDVLVVGLNADASVRRSKGPERPINGEEDRAIVMGALECVDAVTIFEEDEPKSLVSELLPDVLVKGEDWAHYVSGRDIVEANGGRVVLASFVPGRSTTRIIEKIADTKKATS